MRPAPLPCAGRSGAPREGLARRGTSRGTHTTRSPHGALAVALLLLVAITLGAGSPNPPHSPVSYTILVGRLPDALALDPRTSRAFVANDAEATVSVLGLAPNRVLRTLAVGQPGTLAPLALAVAARTHRLFVVDRGDNGAPSVVRVLDSRDGAPLGTVRVGPEADAVAMDERTSHVLVATDDEARERVYVTAWGRLDQTSLPTGTGLLTVLDARSGRLLRTLAVGVALRAVTVEAGSKRVVVVSSGGAIHSPPSWMKRWWQQVVGWAPWLGHLVPRAPDVVLAPGSVSVIDTAQL